MKTFPVQLALCVALIVAGLLGGQTQQASAGPLQRDWVSANAKWVVHMDFDAMRESQPGKMMQAMWLSRDRVRQKMEEVLEKTGMDPRSDLESATMYDDRFEKHSGVALIKVKKIAPQKLLTRLREKHPDMRVSTYEGNKLYTWKASRTRGDKQFMTGALYARSVIVLSRDVPKVMEALDVLSRKTPGLSGSSPLGAEASSGTILLVRSIDMAQADLPGRCPVLRQSDRLSFAAGADGDNLFVHWNIVAKTEEVATNTAAVIQGFRALVTLRHGTDGDVMRVMGGLKTATDGKSVSLDWRAKSADAMKAMWTLKKSHHHRHGDAGEWRKKWKQRHESTSKKDRPGVSRPDLAGDVERAVSSPPADSPTLGWHPIRSMGLPRADHIAIRLGDDRILVAGGTGPEGASASCEIYDPKQDKWHATASMSVERSVHDAVLLADGRVLVFGGRVEGGDLASAEIYDPVGGTWTDAGSLSIARHRGSVNLLDDGKVLVAGGWNPQGFLNTAEIFEPSTGRFRSTGSMKSRRNKQIGVKLRDGRILVAGGYRGGSSRLTTAEVFDPASETWSPIANMGATRYVFAAVLLDDDTVLAVAGGGRGRSRHKTAEIFDVVTNTWRPTGSLARAQSDNRAVKLHDGSVLAIGSASRAAEIYDPREKAWSAAGNLKEVRRGCTVTLLAGGRVIVLGGQNDLGILPSAEAYSPAERLVSSPSASDAAVAAKDTTKSGTANVPDREKGKFDHDLVLAMLGPRAARQVDKNMQLLKVPEALPALVAIMQNAENPKHLRRRAVTIIGSIGNERAREAVVDALGKTEAPLIDNGSSLWSALITALNGCIGRETETQLIRDLKHDNPHVRWLAASQLGRRKSHEAVGDLIELLDDNHHDPRLGATWALGEIQDPQGVEELIAIVEKRRTGGSRVSAIEAMGKAATSRSLQALRSVPRDDSEYWIAEKTLKGFAKKTQGTDGQLEHSR